MRNNIKQNKERGFTRTPKFGVTPKGGGFTIIETMVAISLFLVIVMAGMGSLLNANLLHHKSADMRSIMDNLSFIMEDMSRNLRTGYNYVSTSSSKISFEYQDGDPTNPNDQWVYRIVSDKVEKSIKSGATGSWIQLTPTEVKIGSGSGFTVSGQTLGDEDQPFVTIKLSGTITTKDGVETPFSLRTSVSQRKLDK